MNDNTRVNDHRARWAAIGAAVAVSFGAGGFGFAHATTPQSATAYLAISPCRLVDTRAIPEFHVGEFGTIGPDATITPNGWGTRGQCDLPADTSGLELNVTAIGATEPTFLTVYPGTGQPPNASHLNPAPGAPPTPNAVTVQLDPAGAFSVFNKFGTVDVIIDVVGYYTDHHHDDRYASKRQTVMIPAPAFTPGNNASTYSGNPFDGAYIQQPGGNLLDAPVQIPVGATIHQIEYYVHDSSTTYNLSLALMGIRQPVKSTVLGNSASTVGADGDHTVVSTVEHVIEPDTAYFVRVTQLNWGNVGNALSIKGVRIDYTLP